MPFTVNVGPYQGGNFLFQGLSNLGQGIGGGIQSASQLLKQQKEDQARSDTIFEEYIKTQKISDDAAANKTFQDTERAKWLNLSPDARKGVTAGIIANWHHENMQSEAAARAQRIAVEQAQVDIAKAAQAFTPSAADVQEVTKRGGALVPTSKGHYDVIQPRAAQAGFLPSEEARAEAKEQGYGYVQTAPGKYEPRQLPKAAVGTKEDTPEQLNKDIRAATGHDIGDWLNAGNRREEGDLVVADVLKPVIPGFGNPVQQTMRMPKSQYGAFVQRWKNLQTKAAAATGGAAVLAPNASAGAGTAAGVVPDIVQPPPAATPTPTPTPAPESVPERFMRAIVRNQPLPTATPTLDVIADQISKAKPGKPAPKAAPAAAPAMSTREQAVAILQAQGKLVSEETISTTIKRIEALQKGR